MIPTKYDLHLFTDYMQPVNLSFNQYLLLTEEPVLFHTGSAQQAAALLPSWRRLSRAGRSGISLSRILSQMNAAD